MTFIAGFNDNEDHREARMIEMNASGTVTNECPFASDWTPSAVAHKFDQLSREAHSATIDALVIVTGWTFDDVVKCFESATNRLTSANVIEVSSKSLLASMNGSHAAMIVYAACGLRVAPCATVELDFDLSDYEGFTVEITPVVITEIVHNKGILKRTAKGWAVASNTVERRTHYAALDGSRCGCYGHKFHGKCWHTTAIKALAV